MYDADRMSREFDPDYLCSDPNCPSRSIVREATKERDEAMREAIREARREGLRTAAEFARVMDTGRGNEAEIVRAIERAAEALGTAGR